ncbi:MFS transporter [Streptomyces sp. M10(2022)]
MIGSDVIRVGLVLAMIPVRDSPLLLLVLILLTGIAKAFFETARITAIPLIVRGHNIPTAVALFQSTNHTLNLVGPALGGLLLAFGSVSVVFVIDAATFVISAVLLSSMAVLREVPVPGPDSGRESYWQSLGNGIKGVRAVPSLRFLAVVLVPVMLVLGLFTTNLNSQLLNVFELSAFDFGLAQAGFGAGCVVGALTGPALVRRFSDRGCSSARSRCSEPPCCCSPRPAGCGTPGPERRTGLVPGGRYRIRPLPGAGRQHPDQRPARGLRGRGVGLLNALMVNFTIIGVVLGSLAADLMGITASIIVAGGLLLPVAAVLASASVRSRDKGHDAGLEVAS